LLICSVLIISSTQNSQVSAESDKPLLLWKKRTYGEVKAVSISPDGEYVVAQVFTGFGKKELQLHKNATLLWKRKLGLWENLIGFSSDGKYIFIEENGLSGYNFYVNLIIYDLSGEVVSKQSIVKPSGEITGGVITGTPFEWGNDVAYADNGYIALTDNGESEYHDKGVCLVNVSGEVLWRYTLDYPKRFDDVWISHSGKLVLAKTDWKYGDIEYYLFDSTGNLISKADKSKMLEIIGEYYHSSDVSFSLNDNLLAFLYKDRIIFFDTQFNKISELNLKKIIPDYQTPLKTSMDFYTNKDDIILRLEVGIYENDSVIVLMRPDGTIRWIEKLTIGTTWFPLSNVDMTPDGKYLVVGSKDTYIYLLTDFPETAQSEPEDHAPLWLVVSIISIAVLAIAVLVLTKHRKNAKAIVSKTV